MSIGFEQFGLRQYFEVAFSSCYLGMRKPEQAIYRGRWTFWEAPPSASCSSTIAPKMWPVLQPWV